MLGKIKLGKVRSGIDEFVNEGLIKLSVSGLDLSAFILEEV